MILHSLETKFKNHDYHNLTPVFARPFFFYSYDQTGWMAPLYANSGMIYIKTASKGMIKYYHLHIYIFISQSTKPSLSQQSHKHSFAK